jgi:hypothetical protein
MLKYAVATAMLIFAHAATMPPALAAPGDDAPAAKPYDSEEPARIRQEMDRRAPAPDAGAPAPAEYAPKPERSSGAPEQECANCPPPRRYDSTETVKKTRDVDQSRVINTESVVVVPPRVKEHNKLVIHENETRNVGTVQHNHTIIEKEIRYVKRPPAYHPTVHHRVVKRVETVYVPVPQPQPCGCSCGCSSCGCAGGGLLQSLGQSHYGQAYVQTYAAPAYAGQAYAQASQGPAYVYQPGYAYDAYGRLQKAWVPTPVGGYR